MGQNWLFDRLFWFQRKKNVGVRKKNVGQKMVIFNRLFRWLFEQKKNFVNNFFFILKIKNVITVGYLRRLFHRLFSIQFNFYFLFHFK